ncbi:hypothetical protein [Armatimonas sp.]|uniref:hypothetical protein n=1 Tax=Armatimonas sp. TaxID=1872638 RepID=UPI0037530603
MLNEAYNIYKSLQNASIIPESQHPSITSTLGKSIYVRVVLKEDSHILRINSLSDSDRLGLWTHSVGNGLYFPIVPMDISLFHVMEDNEFRRVATDTKSKPEQKMAALLVIAETCIPTTFDEKNLKKIEARLQQGRELIGKVNQIDQIVERFDKSISSSFFLDDLRAKVITAIKENSGDQATWTNIILGSKIRFALDLEQTIYKDQIRQQLIQALLISESEGTLTSITERTCGVSGKVGSLQTGPFPKVPLLTLGKEYPLFSRFKASECNARYGMLGSESVPIGRETALQMKDAMTWLLDSDRHGKTWRAVASGRMDGKLEKRDLLLAYVEGKPNIEVLLANYIAGGDDEAMEADASVPEEELLVSRFKADTGIVCDALRAVVQEAPQSRLQITLLRKASDGAAFVALSETPTVENLLKGAQWWSEQGRNLPRLKLPLIPKVKGAKLQYASPEVPSPGQAVALFTREWRRGGTEYTPIGGVMLGEILPLLFYAERRKPVAKTLLSLLLPRSIVLLEGIAGAVHRRDDAWNQFNNPSRLFALRTLGCLGICLSALNREKGTYMNESPYQVGQMLALADRLHRDYHIVVRSGPMPPSLIGNAHFGMALENPTKALSVLASRIPVYIGWAKTAQVADAAPDNTRIAVFEARKVLREYETLAAAVHGNLPEKMKDTDKAEMLLGYLAGVEKDEETK